MTARICDERAFRILNILDENSSKCLATVVERQISSEEVADHLFDLFTLRAIPEHIRSDNGP